MTASSRRVGGSAGRGHRRACHAQAARWHRRHWGQWRRGEPGGMTVIWGPNAGVEWRARRSDVGLGLVPAGVTGDSGGGRDIVIVVVHGPANIEGVIVVKVVPLGLGLGVSWVVRGGRRHGAPRWRATAAVVRAGPHTSELGLGVSCLMEGERQDTVSLVAYGDGHAVENAATRCRWLASFTRCAGRLWRPSASVASS